VGAGLCSQDRDPKPCLFLGGARGTDLPALERALALAVVGHEMLQAYQETKEIPPSPTPPQASLKPRPAAPQTKRRRKGSLGSASDDHSDGSNGDGGSKGGGGTDADDGSDDDGGSDTGSPQGPVEPRAPIFAPRQPGKACRVVDNSGEWVNATLKSIKADCWCFRCTTPSLVGGIPAFWNVSIHESEVGDRVQWVKRSAASSPTTPPSSWKKKKPPPVLLSQFGAPASSEDGASENSGESEGEFTPPLDLAPTRLEMPSPKKEVGRGGSLEPIDVIEVDDMDSDGEISSDKTQMATADRTLFALKAPRKEAGGCTCWGCGVFDADASSQVQVARVRIALPLLTRLFASCLVGMILALSDDVRCSHCR